MIKLEDSLVAIVLVRLVKKTNKGMEKGRKRKRRD